MEARGHTWDLWIQEYRFGSWDTHTHKYKRTDLTSDTTPYFHNFIHVHGDTDTPLSLSLCPNLLTFPPRTSLASPVTRLLYLPHSGTQSHILHWFQCYPHYQNFKFSLTLSLSLSLCIDLCLWWSSSLELLMTDHHRRRCIPPLLPPSTTSPNKLWEVSSFLYLFLLYTFIHFLCFIFQYPKTNNNKTNVFPSLSYGTLFFERWTSLFPFGC